MCLRLAPASPPRTPYVSQSASRKAAMPTAFVLAIDQGTTSTRAAVFNERGQCLGTAARPLTQHFPRPGWVEHDADEIWRSVGETVPLALALARISGSELAAIGLTN